MRNVLLQLMKIGIISDTHGYLDPLVLKYFEGCDEIWHAGDIGNEDVIYELEKVAPAIVVYGNIDGGNLRRNFPLHQRLVREGMDIWMTHIGGYPKRYDKRIKDMILSNPPSIFICGHSHIVKVLRDEDLRLIHINPGAAGRYGFHKVRTIVRMELKNKKISNLEVVELGPRTQKVKTT